MTYCTFCNDTLCEKCIEFPWECFQLERCTSCQEELKILKKLWVKYQKGEIKVP